MEQYNESLPQTAHILNSQIIAIDFDDSVSLDNSEDETIIDKDESTNMLSRKKLLSWLQVLIASVQNNIPLTLIELTEIISTIGSPIKSMLHSIENIFRISGRPSIIAIGDTHGHPVIANLISSLKFIDNLLTELFDKLDQEIIDEFLGKFGVDTIENLIEKLGEEYMIDHLTNALITLRDESSDGSIKDIIKEILDSINDDRHIIVMGDFVDRGEFSLENLLLLLIWKLLNPTHVHLLRGNHEDSEICRMYGFWSEFMYKVGNTRYWEILMSIFAHLPLGCIANKNFYCHGGIPMREDSSIPSIDDVNAIDRFLLKTLGNYPRGGVYIVQQLLWGDPAITYSRSLRGGSMRNFSPKQTLKFCDLYEVDCVIRAHEVQRGGWIVNQTDPNGDSICITVFSANNYCGTQNNQGAIAYIDNSGKPTYYQYQNDSDVSALKIMHPGDLQEWDDTIEMEPNTPHISES